MLNQKEINRIIDFRSQGYSYEKIHQITGFSISTIMKFCRQYEKQKKQEKQHIERENTNNIDPIIELHRIKNDISRIIETGKLNEREKRKWEKKLEEIRAILKSEVYERIPNEIADAIKKNNTFWKKEIENNYIRKEIVVNLNNQKKEKDETIIKQRDIINENKRIIEEKDKKISDLEYSKNYEIQELQNKYNKIYNDNFHLKNQISIIEEYIDNKLYDDIQIKRNLLDKEFKKLNNKIYESNRVVEAEKIIYNTLISMEQEKLKKIENNKIYRLKNY